MFIKFLALLTLWQTDKLIDVQNVSHEVEKSNTMSPNCYNNVQPLQTCFYINELDWAANIRSKSIPNWDYSVTCFHCNLTTIPFQNLNPERKKYISSITVIGNMEDNIITLDNNILKNCTNLKRVFISSIQIDDIKSEYFQDAKNIEKIMLRNITLLNSNIPTNIFEHFKNLTYLSIRETNMSTISYEYFKYLKNLQKLLLSYNKIENIDSNTFLGNSHLNEIDLSYNLLTTIPLGLTETLSQLIAIDLSNNPIQTIDLNDIIRANNLKYVFCYNWPCKSWTPYLDSLVKQFKCKIFKNGVCIELYISRENKNRIQIYRKNITESLTDSNINHLPCLKSNIL